MSFVYNICWQILFAGLRLLNFCGIIGKGSKLQRFIYGQRDIFKRIAIAKEKQCPKPVIWIHAASLGEYGVARPIIKQIKAKGSYSIFLTFFSSTGVEALKDNHPEVDVVEYLPIDTRRNARQFINTIKPAKAIFIISEFWPSYLDELKKQNIQTYLISGLIKAQSAMFKWYGGMIRRSLSAFTRFMVLDEASRKNLASIGLDNVTVVGDPLFDNAVVVAKSQYENKTVEAFSSHGDVFIAGSVSDKNDLALVSQLANTHRDIRFLVVPHEISEECLSEVKKHFEGKSIFYKDCDEHTDFSDIQILIIDFIGGLAYMYRYAKWAYVGGGFTPYLHSVIEATVYGLPVAFGPKINRKITPQQMIALGIGCKVETFEELNKWFGNLKDNQAELAVVKDKADAYIRQNTGVTDDVMSLMEI